MKFRIFDKKKNKYIKEFLKQYYINHEGKLFFIYAGDGEHNELHKELAPDRYIVEYSTGFGDIFEGSRINVPVRRSDGRRETNINHTDFFLEMEVMKMKNGAFELRKNKEQYEKLCEPMGKERVSQTISYPCNIQELIHYYDFERVEIIGTIHDGDNNEKAV